MKTKATKQVVNVITLGCSKNVVDSESLMKQLESNGVHVVFDSNRDDVDVVIVNTCGFIQDAKEESIDTILQFAQAKEQGKLSQLYVMGCLSERYKPALQKEIPDVDKFFGVNNIADIVKTLGYNFKDNLLGERLLTTPAHYAYLKISEGCDRQCAFCAIPLIRGKHQSQSLENLVQEATHLANKGVKELILIAQDLSYYGVDRYGKQRLPELLDALCEIPGLEWIRLHYAYPAGFPKEVLRAMREQEKICNYLDIPFQHIADPVLKKMRRGITSRQTYELIERFRSEVPHLTLRTTLLVGHPGEGEAEFEALLDFVARTRFDRLGVFTYSEEEDTFGARNYPDVVPPEVKQERADRIMELQQGISMEINAAKVGTLQKTIIDRKEGDLYIGRTESDSPEVDNEVIIQTDDRLKVGNFYSVEITEAHDFDLMGSIKG